MRFTGMAIVLCLVVMGVKAQTPVKQFYDQDGILTDSARSLYYYFLKPGTMRGNYVFTKTDRLRTKDLIEGPDEIHRTYFYPEGTVKAEGKFVGEKPIGFLNTYYPNGKRQSELYFEKTKPGEDPPEVGIINHWDSLGHLKVDNGEGVCQCNLTPFVERLLIENGRVSNGVRVGVWSGEGIMGNDAFSYTEEYDHGVLKSGIQYCRDSVYHYTKINIETSPEKGFKAFNDQIAEIVKYPILAKRLSIQGTVYIQFTIGSGGSLVDVKTLRGIHKDCDAMAVKAVEGSSKWTPRFFRGRPVKQSMILPVIFKLR